MTDKSSLKDSAHTLYLIDISSFIFRAFFAVRSLTSKTGEPTNAVYGVATMLQRLVSEANPTHLAVVYDSKEPSFRKEIYPEYKANRSSVPEDLIPQFARIEQLILGFKMHSYRQSGVEADDLIATLTKRWCKLSPKNRVVIVSSDKDLMQLIDDRVIAWDTMSNKFYGTNEVIEKFGVPPECIRDYLGLVGDTSDNIPGVPGVGSKTATELLKQFKTMEGILQAAANGEIAGKKCQVIADNAEKARLSAELATLHDSLTIDVDPRDFEYKFQVTPEGIALLRELDFHSLVTRWASAATDGAASTPLPGSVVATEAEAEAKTANSPVAAAAFSSVSHPPSASEPSLAPSPSLFSAAPGSQPFSAPAAAKLTLSEQDVAKTFITVNTKASFVALLEAMDRAGQFGFDLETTSLNPREAELVGIAICPFGKRIPESQGGGWADSEPEAAYYVPVGHRQSLTGGEPVQLPMDAVLVGLKPFIESPKFLKIGQNLKYDFSVLYELGFKPEGIGADTMVAAYVLDPSGRHNLETLAAHYLGYAVQTYEQVCGKGKDQLGFDQIPVDAATRYSAEDAWVSVKLWLVLKGLLKAEDLYKVFEKVDLPLVDVLTRMEREGVCIDVPWLKKVSAEFAVDLKRIEDRIAAFTEGPVNLNSPKQLGQLLFDKLKLPVQGKTKTGYSTDASVLETLAPLHEVPRLLLEYREISKLKGTYVDPLPELRDSKDGKIHAGFHQTVAATGRLSSSDPNLQNIPVKTERGQLIRRAFVPSSGNVLVSADYSQIELRILAHMSGDPDLSKSFQIDEDVHRRTASEIFSVAPENVDDRQRGIAKAINFGLMYGKSAFALAEELGISRKEAADIIARYFKRYSGVKRYLDQSILDAKEKGYACTVLGRKRKLPDINSKNQAVRGSAERMAMNTPIQGTAADLMKIAMIQLDRRLNEEGLNSRLTIQVHDEVVLDCPREEASRVEKLVTEVLENAMKLDVPLRVNTSRGENWMDL
jgi:DNA polymerase-1